MSNYFDRTTNTPAAELAATYTVGLNNPDKASEFRKVTLADLALYCGSLSPTAAVVGTAASGATDGSIKVAAGLRGSGSVAPGTLGRGAVDLQIERTQASMTASGRDSFAGGGNNTISGDYAAAFGSGNTASGSGSFATGTGNTASGAAALVHGEDCAASDNFSIAIGSANEARAQQATVFGGGSCAVDALAGTIVGSSNSSISPDGEFSSIVGGGNHYVDGTYVGVVGGEGHDLLGVWSAAIGGTGGKASLAGQIVQAAGTFDSRGDCQRYSVVSRNATSGATPTELFLNGTSLRILVASGYAIAFTARVFGVSSDGTKAAFYIRQGIAANVAGTCALIGSVQTVGTDIETDAALNVAISATSNYIAITVTGLAATNMRWVANVEAVELKLTV